MEQDEEQKKAEKEVKEESQRVSLALSHHYATRTHWLYWSSGPVIWYTWYQDVKGNDTLVFADRRCKNGEDKEGGRRSSFNSLGGKVGV